jgi:hypothetical protein
MSDERLDAAVGTLELAGNLKDASRVQDANFALECSKVRALIAIAQSLDKITWRKSTHTCKPSV